MAVIALLNGRSTEGIPVVDRGLAYGDGLFETIKVVGGGRTEFLEQHLARLRRDCVRLDIYLDIKSITRGNCPMLNAPSRWRSETNYHPPRYLGRGYQTAPATPAERLLLFFPQVFVPVSLSSAVQVRLCRQRLAEQPTLAGIKHLNRLEQVLARAEWTDPNIAEGLMLDQSGRLIEGTMSNVFLVRDGTVYTPRLHRLRCGRGDTRFIVVSSVCRKYSGARSGSNARRFICGGRSVSNQ